MTNRSQTADLLKGIAVLLMIQVHIIELFATETIFNSNIGKVLLFLGGAPVAPVFMLILGYFIAESKKPTTQLIIRGIKVICLGLLLNIALNFNLIWSVWKGVYNIDILPYIFGVDILPFAGLSIILIVLVKKVLEKNIIFTILFIGAAAFLGHFLLNYIPENATAKYISALFYGSTTWSYFPLFPWLAYPLAGFAYYQLKQQFSLDILNAKATKFILGTLFVIFLIFTGKYAISVSSDLNSYYHHGYIFVIWALLFLAGYSFFVYEIDKLIGNTKVLSYLKWLGKNVTAIYFIQWVITGNIATEIYKTISSPVILLISFISVLLVSSLLAFLFLKMKRSAVEKKSN